MEHDAAFYEAKALELIDASHALEMPAERRALRVAEAQVYATLAHAAAGATFAPLLAAVERSVFPQLTVLPDMPAEWQMRSGEVYEGDPCPQCGEGTLEASSIVTERDSTRWPGRGEPLDGVNGVKCNNPAVCDFAEYSEDRSFVRPDVPW